MTEKRPIISAADLKVVEYLNRYSCLTVKQLVRIFGWKDASYANERMLKLVTLGYVDRKPLPAKGIGRITWVYKLGTEGERYIKEEKRLVPYRFVMGAGKYLMPVWWHTLATQDFFVTAETWVNARKRLGEDIDIEKMATELDIKRDKKNFPPNSSILIPDGWIDIRYAERHRRSRLLLEVETGTQFPAVVREKIKRHIIFADKHYEVILAHVGSEV